MASQAVTNAAEISVLVVLGSLDISSMSDVQTTVDRGWGSADEAVHKSTLIQLMKHSLP